MTQSNVNLVLRADTESFSAAIRQAEHEFSSRFKKMGSASKLNSHSIHRDFNRLGEGVEGFVSNLRQATKHLLILGGAATGLSLLGRHMFEIADSTVQMAAKLGVTTDSLQELRFAASQFGISGEKVESALSVMGKKLGAIARGNTAASKTYEELGISVFEADNSLRSMDAILGDVANVMQGVGSQAERSALATKLFGKEGAAFSLLLRQGAKDVDAFRAQAHALGVVIDEELLNHAEHASTQLEVLGRIFKAHVMVAFAQFAPVVINVTQKLTESIPTLKAFTSNLLELKQALIFTAEVFVGMKLMAFAQSLNLTSQAFIATMGSAIKFSNVILLLSKALKTLGAGLAIYTLVEGLSVLKQQLDFKGDIKRYIQSQYHLINANQNFSNSIRLNVDDIKKLSHAEQLSYRERIKGAQQFWQSRLTLESRKDDMSQAALSAAKENRLFFENLKSIEAILSQRSAVETAHVMAVNQVRAEEAAQLKQSLSDQLKLYDDANQKLAQLQDKRKDIAQEFNTLIADINAPSKKAQADLTVLDITSAQDAAKAALKSGDIEQAFRSANQAKDVIRSLMQAEGVTKSYLAQQASATAEIAGNIAQREIKNQETQLSTIQQKITEIVAQADLLKHIIIAFDEKGAVQSVDDIRDAIQKQLLNNPVTLPMVVISKTDNLDARVDTMLKPQKKARGGMINGAGTSMSDSILAQLSRGEFVVRASAVKHYGAGLLNQLNQRQLPKFATGGLVPPSVPLISKAAPEANGQVANLTLNLGSEKFTVATPSVDVVQALTKAVAREALKSGRRE